MSIDIAAVQLEAIRRRDAEAAEAWFDYPPTYTSDAVRDRRALLALLDSPQAWRAGGGGVRSRRSPTMT